MHLSMAAPALYRRSWWPTGGKGTDRIWLAEIIQHGPEQIFVNARGISFKSDAKVCISTEENNSTVSLKAAVRAFNNVRTTHYRIEKGNHRTKVGQFQTIALCPKTASVLHVCDTLYLVTNSCYQSQPCCLSVCLSVRHTHSVCHLYNRGV